MRFSLSSFAVLAAVLIGTVAAAPAPSDFAIKKAQGFRLLELEDSAEPVWKSEAEKLDLMRAKTPFFDITDVYEQDQITKAIKGSAKAAKATFPSGPTHQTAVNSYLSKLSTSSMQSYLTTLTAYNNRYYKATTGAQAATWIQTTLKSIASSASRTDVTVTAFTHSWTQTSTIARIAGTSTTGAVTILGAHMDSINLNSPTSGRAPGADDDGSGTVNLIEVFRVLVSSGYKPTTPLEFHFYSGEEGGLLGSQAIASSYYSKGTAVKAMLELDMTAYFKPGTTEYIAFMTDNTDAGLTTFSKTLATAYTKLPTYSDKCGYGCSDHASWYKYGYPSVIPFEAPYSPGYDNPNIHSTADTTSVNGFSWSHSLEFAKLALGFAVELSSA